MKKTLPILIALALALVVTFAVLADTTTIYSDTSVKVYGPLNSYAAPGDPAWGTSPVNAVQASTIYAGWNSIATTLSPAIWISNTTLVADPKVDTWRWFRKTVQLCEGAHDINGTITATSDNAEYVYVNGDYIGFDGVVEGYVTNDTYWSTIKNYYYVNKAGTLTFDFIVRNYAYNTTNPNINPTGLIFKATIDFDCNTPPVADAGESYSGYEGSPIIMSGASASDTDLDPLTYSWSVDNTTLCSFDNPTLLKPNLTCTDNGIFTATLSVEDGVNTAVTDQATVTVANVAPVLTGITVSTALLPVNTVFTAGASFTDAGTSDTHTANWVWGDGNTSGTVTQGAGFGSVSDSHTYATPGVYTIRLTVTDDDGGVSNEVIYEFVVVYDPSAGFVTGGGWFMSPVGAYKADETLEGKATFGFVAKYKKGANVPDGNTEFQFKAGDLNFKSTSYEWLVVAGTNAMFKGVGTINGQGSYMFQITADDGSPDQFRIKIEGDTGIVYDNGPQQALGGGSIVVHK